MGETLLTRYAAGLNFDAAHASYRAPGSAVESH